MRSGDSNEGPLVAPPENLNENQLAYHNEVDFHIATWLAVPLVQPT
jgi:hypothetical protein